ncbi:MAG: fructose-1,6-bisphosphatase [Lachnospiraceae bacterium]|nr:fructose-1,6-bisphosphatase [Lachnospiraceae bacterium]
MEYSELKYLKSLAKQYPTVDAACTEIINLQSILNLPKGTEHFLTDLHGEHEQFEHVMKNGSGSVRRKIDEEFGHHMSQKDKKSLATLIYYPKEKLELVAKTEDNMTDWYTITLHRLVQMAKYVSSKYTRSKVRKALPKEFAYVIEELITEKAEVQDKEAYYNAIISTIIRIGKANDFIIALSNLIQRLVVDHLHIVGDIYDRGPGPFHIMEKLCSHHSVDVQWGNHDVVWMAAASGHLASIAAVIRLCAKYGNMSVIENDYAINLIPLVTFVMETYSHTDCDCFTVEGDGAYGSTDQNIDTLIHKAATILQLKLEGQTIMRNPDFKMENRLLLDKIDFAKKTVCIDGKEYRMKDTDFPTVDPENPYELSAEEALVMERLCDAFMKSYKLQKHTRFLFSKGGMYKVYNGNLLYHGCVPLNQDGTFTKVTIGEKQYSGKALYDVLENYARKGFYSNKNTAERIKGQDVMWYIGNGPGSPVFGKDKFTVFERYFVEDEVTHTETKNIYYKLCDNEKVVESILEEFGLDKDTGHIVNGHVPVVKKKGESPIKCGGKLLIIDGGFAKAYHEKTGIAGYTLVNNSRALRLVSHEEFESKEAAIVKESDIFSASIEVENYPVRKRVADTDAGKEIQKQIEEIECLLYAYQEGLIAENS